MKEKIDILIVEDDQDLSDMLASYLINSNYTVKVINDPLDVMTSLKSNNYKIILLDLTLPKMDGLVLCELIRK